MSRQRLFLPPFSPCQRRSLLAVRWRLLTDRLAGAAGFDSAVAAACASGAGCVDGIVDGALFAVAESAFNKTGLDDVGCDCAGCVVAAPAGACASSPLLACAAAIGAGVPVAKTGGAAITGVLVTSACAASELSASAPGRSSRVTTTAAPAVAPTAVATSTVRTLRRKLGAGAR